MIGMTHIVGGYVGNDGLKAVIYNDGRIKVNGTTVYEGNSDITDIHPKNSRWFLEEYLTNNNLL